MYTYSAVDAKLKPNQSKKSSVGTYTGKGVVKNLLCK